MPGRAISKGKKKNGNSLGCVGMHAFVEDRGSGFLGYWGGISNYLSLDLYIYYIFIFLIFDF